MSVSDVAVGTASAAHECNTLRTRHNVQPGASWGTLPVAGKRRWAEIACDHTDLVQCHSNPPCGVHLGRACTQESPMCLPVVPGQEPKGVSLFQPRCSNGADQVSSWPRFDSLGDLVANSRWARYFRSVYGELPMARDFPVCTFDFWSIDKPKLDSAGITTPSPVRKRVQPRYNERRFNWTDGELFGRYHEDNPQFYHGFAIYHSDRPYVKHNQWVEVTHHRATNTRGTADEASGRGANMWFTYAPGSGVWYWTGRTGLFDSHDAAARALCHNVTSAKWLRTALIDDGFLSVCARRAGFDTIAFRSSRMKIQNKSCELHDLVRCPAIVTTSGTVATMGMVGMLELFAPRLAGRWSCGQRASGGKPLARFRAGWRASRECVCNNSEPWLNCA